VAKKLGIDYASAHSLNERIIYCSITGFGQTGPFSHISGHDLVIQSLAGFMALGTRESEIPQVPGFLAADYASASVACIGILSAIINREKTGEGCNIDLSMFDSLFSMCNIALTGAMARAGGAGDDTEMEAWGGNPRYANYATRDGKFVAVALLEQRLWQSFCDVIDRSDLVDDDESPDARHTAHGERAGAYKEAIEGYCLSKDRDEIVEQMARHGVPISPIYSPDEALASDLVRARGLADFVDHPEHGSLPQIANPLAGSGLVRTRRNHAPGLGADARSVLKDLGFDDNDVKKLIEAGVIQR
jgi:crotonobetainyl-CoA:carnitine CoA-transferase CaiB-like acyl-CoA transferase